ncbi:MAG: PQQ-binding-like beta-propeller repeat protein [Cyanobacteria bacterium]|nr:PQQ-binding-like beta-propeller repeat protein [Cyanobacteriota bacterium]
MALFFALLLALFQAPATPAPASFDARWVTAFETPASAAPGFDATTAYVPLNGGKLVAVDLNRGTIRWQLDLQTPFTPATGEGLVFTVTDQVIEAREAATGTMKWQTPLPGGAAVPLYWDTGWLLASTTAGDLAAFRANDGVLVWRRQLGAPLAGAPGPALDRLFLPLADTRLVALQLSNGETVWEKTLSAPVTALLALDDQLVFGTGDKKVVSVDLTRGRERWTWDIGGDIAGIPTADDKRIYFASRDNILRAVDRKSGNLRWKANLSSRPAGGPLRLGDALLMPLVSNQILGFDPMSGKPSVTAAAAGEIGLQPYVRRDVRQTQTQLITVSREGQLQGFGRRFEPVPQALGELPGAAATP